MIGKIREGATIIALCVTGIIFQLVILINGWLQAVVFNDNNVTAFSSGFIAFVTVMSSVACVALPVMGVIFWANDKRKNTSAVLIIMAMVVCLFLGTQTAYSGYCYWQRAQVPIEPNRQYNEISLDELEQYIDDGAGAEYIIYIGRKDCPECKDLEDVFTPLLKTYAFFMPTYYTSQDRDGPRRNEMYSVLDHIGVTSVPTVLVIKNGIVEQAWIEPTNEIGDIEVYVSNNSKASIYQTSR